MIANGKKQNGTFVYKKHHQRSTLTDIRGPPKKSGAGNGNWGVVGDEINTEEHKLMMTTNTTNVQLSHIKVVAPEEFMKLKNSFNTKLESVES